MENGLALFFQEIESGVHPYEWESPPLLLTQAVLGSKVFAV